LIVVQSRKRATVARNLQIKRAGRKVLRSFNSERVKYVVVGSVAARFHGGRKVPSDLDLLIDCSVENAPSVERALRSLGLPLPSPVEDLCKAKKRLELWFDGHTYEVDVLMEVAGASFEDLYRDRCTIRTRAGEVSIASAEDVAAMEDAVREIRPIGKPRT